MTTTSTATAVDRTILVVSELYFPETTSTGYFLTGIAEALAQRWTVRVLCSQPTYSQRGVLAPRHEQRNGTEITRCFSTRFSKDHLPGRLLNLVTASVSMGWNLTIRARHGDIVLVVTNPPLLPFMATLAARLRGARVILLIHDVYPEVLIATGFARPGSLLVRTVARLTRWLYRSVDQVIALGRDMKALVERKLDGAPQNVVIIPNWGDVVRVRPQPRNTNRVLSDLGLRDKFVIQFLGNIGRTHGVEMLIDAARLLAADPRVHFLFVGWGGRRAWLEETVARENLGNVTVRPGCSDAELPDFLNAADIAVIPFLPGMSGVSVPSRLYNVLAAGKPVLAVADPDSELARVVIEERVGWVVVPGDLAGLVEAIGAAADPAARAEMGLRAREAAVSSYSYEKVGAQYEALIDRMMGT
jgi:glycosyltransferase involved in cell wall biosynthesis